MSNRTLKIFYPPYFPHVNPNCPRFPYLKVTAFCRLPGMMVEILNLITKDANITITPIWDPQQFDEWDGQYDAKKVLMLFGNQSFDMIAVAFQSTTYRAQRYAFSESVYNVTTRILKRVKERRLERIWSLFQTYDYTVWMAIGVVFLIQCLFCIIARRVEANRLRKKPNSFLDCIWETLRVQLMQPDKTKFRTAGGSFAMSTFSFFQCSIIIGLFSSIILASIICDDKIIDDPISDMIRRIGSGSFYMVTNDPKKWIFEKINTSRMPPYSDLRRVIRKNPLRIVETREQALHLVATENALLFQQTDEGSFYDAMRFCELKALEENMPVVGAHLMLRKEHPLLPDLNLAIRRNSVLLRGIARKYYWEGLRRRRCSKDAGDYDLAPMVGVFGVCGCILVVAIGFFIIELCSYRMKNGHWFQRKKLKALNN